MHLRQLVAGRRGPVLIGAAVLVTVVGGGGAVAAGLVTSRQILDHTVGNADLAYSSVGTSTIRDESIYRRDLAFEVRDGADGARGRVGPAGADGATGGRGATGLPGADGDPGDPGPGGLAGDPGPDGASAYEVYVESVPSSSVPMTEPQWLASLEGDQGTNGTPGTNGTNGTPGANGAQGPPGAIWARSQATAENALSSQINTSGYSLVGTVTVPRDGDYVVMWKVGFESPAAFVTMNCLLNRGSLPIPGASTTESYDDLVPTAHALHGEGIAENVTAGSIFVLCQSSVSGTQLKSTRMLALEVADGATTMVP